MLIFVSRLVVPARIALIYRAGESLGYNPAFNVWYRLDDDCAEVLRWLRAGRDRNALIDHLVERFDYKLDKAEDRLQEIMKWCILRKLLYLDQEPPSVEPVYGANSLSTVYWICTQACNLRCTYCYQEAMKPRSNELSTAEAKDLIDQVVEAGAQAFVFTGGEPFLRHDLLELARYCKSSGLRTNVITNGSFIHDKNVQDVAKIFDLVTVSLDHMVPEHHDRHRGKGSWERAVKAIDLLLESGVCIFVNSALSRYGLQDVDKLLQLEQTRAIEGHRIVPQFPMGRGSRALEDELTPTELLQLNDQLYSANHYLMGEGSRVKSEGTNNKKGSFRIHCGAGLSEVSIDSEGWVYPCKLLQYPQFRTQNIRNNRLVDIFSKDTLLKAIRSAVVDTLHPCKTCIIKSHCGGGCRGIQFSFTKEYVKSDPVFCSFLRRSFEVEAWDSTGGVPAHRQTTFHDTPNTSVPDHTSLT